MGGGGKKSSTYYCGLKKRSRARRRSRWRRRRRHPKRDETWTGRRFWKRSTTDWTDGEIGSRAIHGCVVVVSFLLCLLLLLLSVCVCFACFLARVESLFGVFFASSAFRIDRRAEGKIAASCIKKSDRKKRSRCRSLSYHRSNETTASQPKSDDGPPGEIDRSTRADDTTKQQ